MDVFFKVGKELLKLCWCLIKIVAFVVDAVSENKPRASNQYTHREAYELLHEDSISISEFVDSTKE